MFLYLVLLTSIGSWGCNLSKDQLKQVECEISDKTLISLPAMYVNLSDHDMLRYAKISIGIEFSNNQGVEYIQKNLSWLKDNLLILYSSKTSKEIITPEGKMRLKEQIKEIVDSKLKNTSKVIGVYFTEFIVQ